MNVTSTTESEDGTCKIRSFQKSENQNIELRVTILLDIKASVALLKPEATRLWYVETVPRPDTSPLAPET